MLKIYCEDKHCFPERAHPTDAGLDLRASREYELMPNKVTLIDTGIRLEIPYGMAGFIYPRSGLASKKNIVLANTVGIIDSDYRGKIYCAIKWGGAPGDNPYARYRVQKYDRIAQLVIQKVWIGKPEFINELSDTERGEGGFGHTGN